MNIHRGILITSLLLALVIVPPHPPASAQTQTADLLAQIAALQTQLAELQAQIAATRGATTAPTVAPFTQFLAPGRENGEVARLQQFLATLPGIYPEGIVSGYYGPLTTAAVRRFQARYGINTLGIVGPATRAQLNALHSPLQTEDEANATPPPTITVRDDKGVLREVSITPDVLTLPDYDIPALEHGIHELINDERENRGLRQLSWNRALARVARLHSEDQAKDNEVITDASRPCTYPLLRHEGKTRGLTVLERTKTLVDDFRRVGENIVTFPLTDSSVYAFSSGEGPVVCPAVEEFDFHDFDTPEERLREFNEAVEEREEALEDVRQVAFVRREWKSEEDIVEKAVELWMSSPGHRRNVLFSDYNEAGVGIAAVNNYFIITQVFIEAERADSPVFLESR